MKTPFNILAVLIVALCAMSFAEAAGPWVKLGSRKASMKTDHDEILVTGQRGTFNALKLTVENAGVMFHRVVVHYRNGTRETLNIRKRIDDGGETRALNLKGRNRIIRKVVFYYQSEPLSEKKAKITLFGMH